MKPGTRGYFLAMDPEIAVHVIRQLTGTEQSAVAPGEKSTAGSQAPAAVEAIDQAPSLPPELAELAEQKAQPTGTPAAAITQTGEGGLDVDTEPRVRDRLYRLAKKKGFKLQLCRSHDEGPDYSTYRIVNRATNVVVHAARLDGYGLTLDQVDQYLSTHSAV